MPSRHEPPSLLLLPLPPSPLKREILSAAYRPSLTAALSSLKTPFQSDAPRRLVVAVACPLLEGPVRAKTTAWTEAQSLLAGIYSLISLISAELSLATEVDAPPDMSAVDTTVILIDHDGDRQIDGTATHPGTHLRLSNTPVLDMLAFSAFYHPWNHIFHVCNEQGLQLYKAWLGLAERLARPKLLQQQLVLVDGGLNMNEFVDSASAGPATTRLRTSGYPVVCLGGTFDHLHPGHKLLLTAGALLLRIPDAEDTEPSALLGQAQGTQPAQYIIGVTGDDLLRNKKFAEFVQPWEDRARAVIRFLAAILHASLPKGRSANHERSVINTTTDSTVSSIISAGFLPGSGSSSSLQNQQQSGAAWDAIDIDESRDGDFRATFRKGTIVVSCVRIQDPFGPTITQEDIGALVVSAETRSGGQAVNDKRAEQGWKALDVYEVDVLMSSSEDSKAGEGVSEKGLATMSKATGVAESFASKISSSAIRQQRAMRVATML